MRTVITMKKTRLSACALIFGITLAAFMLAFPAAAAQADTVCTTLEEAGDALRKALIDRTAVPKVLVDFDFVLDYSPKEVLNEARKYTGPGSLSGICGDYLKESIMAGTTKMSTEAASGDNYYLVYKIPGYYTTADQEAQLTKDLVSEYNMLKLDGRSEAGKIKVLYDNICGHVKYDMEEGYSTTIVHPRAYAAFGALHYKSAVCQGYAALFYRMCNEQGIACRIVTGKADGGSGQENHAWNVVRIGSNWYNVDCTWDAGRSPSSYKFFLKSNADFKDHWRGADYTTSTFNAACPMASESYRDASLGINADGGSGSSGQTCTLTVSNGSGGGKYTKGSTVVIRANAASSGQVFSRWDGTATFTNNSSATSSTATVKVTSDIHLEAKYKDGEADVRGGIYKLKCKSNARYLVVKKDSSKINAPIVPGAENAKTSAFKVSKSGSFYYIMNKKTKKYVSLKGNKVVQAKKNNTSKWKMVSVGDGYFKLVNLNGKVITVSGNSATGTANTTADNKKIQLVS